MEVSKSGRQRLSKQVVEVILLRQALVATF